MYRLHCVLASFIIVTIFLIAAIKQDKIRNIKRFYGRSLVDSFEWTDGYQFSFGFCLVNFSDSNLNRVPKFSSYFYQQVIKDNGFKPGYPGPGGLATAPIKSKDGILYGTFPENFILYTASAAYQIEGGWNADGMFLEHYPSLQNMFLIFEIHFIL